MKRNEPDISENFGHGWCLEALFHNESKILCNDYLTRKWRRNVWGGGGGDKDEKGTRYRKELTCSCMLGIVTKSNGIIVAWDSFAGCVYVCHLDFKHHSAEK